MIGASNVLGVKAQKRGAMLVDLGRTGSVAPHLANAGVARIVDHLFTCQVGVGTQAPLASCNC